MEWRSEGRVKVEAEDIGKILVWEHVVVRLAVLKQRIVERQDSFISP